MKHTSNDRGVEVLAVWYEAGENLAILPKKAQTEFYFNIDHYIATVSNHVIKSDANGQIYFEKDISATIKKELDVLQ